MSILTINDTILRRFDIDLEDTKEKLAVVDDLLTLKDSFNITTITNLNLIRKAYRTKLSSDNKDMFIAQTGLLIQRYKDILSKPMAAKDKKAYDKYKKDIEVEFLRVVSRIIKVNQWYDIIIPTVEHKSPEPEPEQDTFDTEITYRDYDRVNIVSKFSYSRVSHFQECIKQYQGKQNCKIPKEVLENLEKKFKAFKLLNDTEGEVKYGKITREHIFLFLKQLGYTNQYENVNFIYCILTGKKIDDIEHLEYQLIEDFKELTNLYDQVHGKDKHQELKRKNFMNVQYILYQLLRNRNHPCSIKDFSVLKTVEKKKFHDEVCSKLFEQLGWNFTPTF